MSISAGQIVDDSFCLHPMSLLNDKEERTTKVFPHSHSVPWERMGEELSAEKPLEKEDQSKICPQKSGWLGCRCGIRAICYKR